MKNICATFGPVWIKLLDNGPNVMKFRTLLGAKTSRHTICHITPFSAPEYRFIHLDFIFLQMVKTIYVLGLQNA